MNTNLGPIPLTEQAQDLTIVIPAHIAALTDLTLQEKFVLAHINRFSGCSNSKLAKLTGMSIRWIEVTLARFRERGLIKHLGKGRARRHQLLFPVEHHIPCGKHEITNSRKECGDATAAPPKEIRPPSIETFVEQQLLYYSNCIDLGEISHARNHLELIHKALTQDMLIPQERKESWLASIKLQEDRCFAYEIGLKVAEQLPPDKQERLALALCKASAEKLALFREQVEAGALTNDSIDVLAWGNG